MWILFTENKERNNRKCPIVFDLFIPIVFMIKLSHQNRLGFVRIFIVFKD